MVYNCNVRLRDFIRSDKKNNAQFGGSGLIQIMFYVQENIIRKVIKETANYLPIRGHFISFIEYHHDHRHKHDHTF